MFCLFFVFLISRITVKYLTIHPWLNSRHHLTVFNCLRLHYTSTTSVPKSHHSIFCYIIFYHPFSIRPILLSISLLSCPMSSLHYSSLFPPSSDCRRSRLDISIELSALFVFKGRIVVALIVGSSVGSYA